MDEGGCDYDVECPHCHGAGEIIVCPDDMCRGLGECMHGDGMEPCPAGCEP